MSENIKTPILTKETLIPAGMAIAGLFVVLSVASYAINQAADIRSLREWQIAETAKSVSLESRLSAIEQAQVKVDTKIDYALKSLDAISKKLNIVP